MAILWQQDHKHSRYQIRTAGQTRRLYKDGVLHSQYHPDRFVTGSVWDLLFIPALLYPRAKMQRILVLGVGGGTVIRALRHFLQPQQIVGIEYDKLHLGLPQRFLGLRKDTAELYHADARNWIAEYAGDRFDLIIDDLFNGVDGEPHRAVAATADWYRQLLGLLSRDGMLVLNFASRIDFRASACFTNRRLGQRFRHRYEFTTANIENAVGVLARGDSDARRFRDQLVALPGLSAAQRRQLQRHRLVRVRG